MILFDSNQIGPQNGTDQLAQVYRVDVQAAVRQPEIERRLEGVRQAAEVRRHLAKAVGVLEVLAGNTLSMSFSCRSGA